MLRSLPVEIIFRICFMLDFESLNQVLKVAPQMKNIVHPIHLRKAEEIITKLDKEYEDLKVKIQKNSNNMKFLVDIGHCPLHLKHTLLNMGETLKKCSKLKRKKEKIQREIEAKVEESYDPMIQCHACGVLFTDFEIARSHILNLSLYC